LATYSLEAPSSAKSESATFAAKITGLYVRRLYELSHSNSSSSFVSKLFASLPSSR
jgi:hypothetical protein